MKQFFTLLNKYDKINYKGLPYIHKKEIRQLISELKKQFKW